MPSPYLYKVSVVSGRVVISGKNGGSIRAGGGQKVTFEWDGNPGSPGFTMSATTFERNGSSLPPASVEPFDDALPTTPVQSFESHLVRPEKGSAQLVFKYTVEAGNADPADPIIIIEK